MVRVVAIVLVAAALALLPVAAHAQERDEDDGLLFRAGGDITIEEGQRVEVLIAAGSDVTVRGVVQDLVAFGADVVVEGRVTSDITAFGGDVRVTETGRVHNVNLFGGELEREAGATITGDVEERDGRFFTLAGSVFLLVVWVVITVGVLIWAAVFAAVAGRQLRGAAALLTDDVAYTILAAVFVWVGGPIVAAIAFATVAGLPLAIGIVFSLPALLFLGYIAAGTRIGLAIVGRRADDAAHGRRRIIGAALLGVLILQVVLLIPLAGVLVGLVAGLYGSGALGLMVWRALRGRVTPAPAPAP
jgi:hypothetical protein